MPLPTDGALTPPGAREDHQRINESCENYPPGTRIPSAPPAAAGVSSSSYTGYRTTCTAGCSARPPYRTIEFFPPTTSQSRVGDKSGWG